MHNSIFYVVCCNILCIESGNIKKNLAKCPECKKTLMQLTLEVLNTNFCPCGQKCQSLQKERISDDQYIKCKMLHPTKKHQSPPYISPCLDGLHCSDKKCVFLHPNKKCVSWIVRI
jgi:hypothetical protein